MGYNDPMSRPKKKPQPLVTPAIIRRVVKTIVREFQPEKIILFGSQARGKPRWDSDLDILIIGESDLRPVDRSVAVRMLFLDQGFPMDIIYYTPEQVNRWKEVRGSWIHYLVHEGKVIYARKNH